MLLGRTQHTILPLILWCSLFHVTSGVLHATHKDRPSSSQFGQSDSPVMDSDVLLLRDRPETHSDHPLLIQVAQLSSKHPQWWTWLPKTTSALQKKGEKLYHSYLAKNGAIPGRHQRILQSFWNRHLPITLDGWTVYGRLVSSSVLTQQLKRRLSSATPESYCALYKVYHPLLQGKAPPQLAALLVNLHFGSIVPVKQLLATLATKGAKGQPVLPEHRLLAQLLSSIPSSQPLAAYTAYAKKHTSSSSWMPSLTVAAILYCIRYNHSQKACDLFLTLSKSSMDTKTVQKLETMVKRQLWQEGQKWEAQGRLAQARGWYHQALRLPVQGSALDRIHSEYMHGLICLFGLSNPQQALNHFLKSSQNVFNPQQLHPTAMAQGKHPLKVLTPLGVGRQDVAALFWLGACAYRLGKPKLAQRYWENAARYSLFAYGQWALWMLKRPIKASFPRVAVSSRGWKTPSLKLCQRIVDVWHHYEPKKNLAMMSETTYPLCLDVMSLSQSPEALYYTLRMIKEIYPQHVCESGKTLGKHYAGMFQETYPTPVLNGLRWGKDDISLIYGLVRTESSFRPTSMAITMREKIQGYMMIRHMTAEFITKKNKIKLDEQRFKKDPSYHLFLGSLIIDNLLERAFGSYPVAVAAYNAGLSPANQWKLSVPYTPSDPFHALYWMESIPFTETRHYVTRVLEAYTIYRTLMHKPISVREWTKMMTIHRGGSLSPKRA